MESVIDIMARVFRSYGGDAEGFLWTYRRIYERILELEKEDWV